MSICDGLNTSIVDLSSRLELMTTNMERQNSIILGMEGQFRETFAKFSQCITELYEFIKHSSINSSAASTSKHMHWGRAVK